MVMPDFTHMTDAEFVSWLEEHQPAVGGSTEQGGNP